MTPHHVGALEVTTEIPTPQGITLLGDLRAGQSVFGADGRAVPVLELDAPVCARDCFEIEFATGERLVADGDQRLILQRRGARWASAAPGRLPATAVAAAVAAHGPAEFAVRVAPAVQLNAKRLPVEPYLFGAWLGAGVPGQAALHQADPELVRLVADSGARVFTSGLPGRHWVAGGGTVRRGDDLATRLRDLGVLDSKHVPMVYLRSSEEQRRSLLAGLLDAAATVSDHGEIVLRTASAGLAAGAHQLIASLGLRPHLRPRRGGVDVVFLTADPVFGRDSRVALLQARRRLSADARPRRLVRSVTRVPGRRVRRVRVGSDDGVLLVGRSFIPVPGAVLDPAARATSLARSGA